MPTQTPAQNPRRQSIVLIKDYASGRKCQTLHLDIYCLHRTESSEIVSEAAPPGRQAVVETERLHLAKRNALQIKGLSSKTILPRARHNSPELAARRHEVTSTAATPCANMVLGTAVSVRGERGREACRLLGNHFVSSSFP